MALQPQIAAFKSSGVYRLEFDKSQIISIPAEQIRLVVGFSKKGPFNTPIYVPDTGYFIDVFGSIDRTLENAKSYFHRTALAALERGPIIALNLLRLDTDSESDDYDEVESICFSTSATHPNDLTAEDGFGGFYNRSKFWYPDTDSFIGNVTSTGNKLFNLVNLDKRPLTVLVKRPPAADLRGFNITAKEWYGVADVPTFMHQDDYISDFMIDVILLDGDFGPRATDTTPYERFASDPLFADYFDNTRGLKRKLVSTDAEDTAMDAFLNLSEVNYVAKYQGSLIPDFTDLTGLNLFIESLVNQETAKTGLFCSVNRDPFMSGDMLSGVDGGIDMVGHNLEFEQPTTIDFLSYSETIKSDLEFAQNASVAGLLDLTNVVITDDTAGNIMFSVSKADNLAFWTLISGGTFKANTLSPRVMGSYVQTDGGLHAPVVTVQFTATTAYFEVSGENISATDFTADPLPYFNVTDLDWLVDDNDGADASSFLAGYSSDIYVDIENGILTTGDTVLWDADSSGTPIAAEQGFIQIEMVNHEYVIDDQSGTYTIGAITDTRYPVLAAKITAFSTVDFTVGTEIAFSFDEVFFYADDSVGAADLFIAQTLKGALNETLPATKTALANVIEADSSYADSLHVGSFLVSDNGGIDGPSRLTRITAVALNGTTLTVTALGKILVNNSNQIEVYQDITDWVDYYKLFSLDGFTHTAYHLPNGTQEQLNNILNDTIVGTKLYDALVDKENIIYRYIVDSFGLGVQANSKDQFTKLAYGRQNAFAILNAPSMEDFKNSTNPYFLDAQGLVDSKMISEGGDLTKNPTVLYTLPSVPNGSNYAAFYVPYVLVRDRGKNVKVPPAGYISNNFIDKYTNALPWSIVAGARRGVLSGKGLVGIEYNFAKAERDYLEPFGLNPVVFQSGVGIVILGNKTAQQNIKSALSNIHVREVLIYIQDGIAAILKNYLFEFNTPQIRLEIKTLADNFLKQIQADRGVYDYKNVMDETNNTSEVIDNNIGILDTYVEPVRGLEILVHRTTILKTGSIATGEYL